jgi:hypothetical protein
MLRVVRRKSNISSQNDIEKRFWGEAGQWADTHAVQRELSYVPYMVTY